MGELSQPAPSLEADSTVVDAPRESEAAPLELQARSSSRYTVVARGETRVIFCANAPNIELHVQRGLSVDEKGRKRYDQQTIFLDGVYTGAPFRDNERLQYSLDHHAGCVRAFTLATCEQAVVMLLSGLPLSTGTWKIYVNEPDLDAMLATWVLMNHVELLQDERALLEHVMPVIRVEGVIDSHGTEKVLLAALPKEAYDAARAQVDSLVGKELQLKRERQWGSTDYVEHAVDRLEEMDRELLPEGALSELRAIQESGRATLDRDRFAVLIESGLGIYEIEERLKERYGVSLGVVALRTDEKRYTLRLVDAFLPRDLEPVYKALNKIDPLAVTKGDEPNAWGGSGDIGGSPRATGTGLTGDQILAVLGEVLGPPVPWWKRFKAWLARLFGGGTPPALPPPSEP